MAGRLAAAGFGDVEVRTVLSPAWTTDWITAEGRRKLAEAGIAPPGAAPRRTAGPVPLTLSPTRQPSPARPADRRDTGERPRSAARPARTCTGAVACAEPFEHVKEI